MNPLTRRGDTPTRSPFAKTPNPRSPTKASRQELGLSLQQVIGTTCNSVSCFDVHPQSASFAYTAGAAAVVATVGEDLKITQRFFRATPTTAISRSAFTNGSLQPPASQQEYRNRLVERTREGSPFGGSSYEGSDSPNGKGASARERVKAATAVSLSRNGKYIAVGETGYKPRVLIFSLNGKTSAEAPVATISEHSFGVQAVAFSPDSKLLATLGTVNDGFLHIWDVDERTGAATLMASNKCTNIVKQIAWIGRCLITVGVRFVKVWRPDEVTASSGTAGDQTCVLSSPNHKPLAGRNTLLGDLLEATFTAVVSLSETKAALCTDAGDVCLLDDTDKQQRLDRLQTLDFGTTAACVSSQSQLIVSGAHGGIAVVDLSDLSAKVDSPYAPDSLRAVPPRKVAAKAKSFPMAVGLLPNALITIENSHSIQLRRPPGGGSDDTFPVLSTLSAHAGPVLGLRALSSSDSLCSSFLTWSDGGSIIGWNSAGDPTFTLSVPLEQVSDTYNMTNELRTVSSLLQSSHVVTGDRYGVLRVLDIAGGQSLIDMRAHSAEITDVAVHETASRTLVASCSRDRTIQLFQWGNQQLELRQTLDEHAGAVTGLLFAKDGSQLLSCSADRTVVVRQTISRDDGGPMIYAILRTITLKSSPTAMRVSAHEYTILLSTADRSVQLVNISNGRTTQNFKASDFEGGDPVALSSLVHLPSATGGPIVAGVSSTDKSVRLYSDDGFLLARDWGHTEGVTDIALIDDKGDKTEADAPVKLVTVAADGTIFMWNAKPIKASVLELEQQDDVLSPIMVASPVTRPPLRKVISSSEIIRLQRSQAADDGEVPTPTTPTALRSSALRKKPSRLSVNPAPRLSFSPMQSTRQSSPELPGGFRSRQKSPSPPLSPRYAKQSTLKARRISGGPTLNVRTSNQINGPMGNGAVTKSGVSFVDKLAEQLRSSTKELEASIASTSPHALKALEEELESTLRLVQRLRPSKEDKTTPTVDSFKESVKAVGKENDAALGAEVHGS